MKDEDKFSKLDQESIEALRAAYYDLVQKNYYGAIWFFVEEEANTLFGPLGYKVTSWRIFTGDPTPTKVTEAIMN